MTDADGAPRDDRALLAAHVSGDPTAFDELVRRHRDRLWSVARRVLDDPEDAADAVQDGLVSALRAAGSYRGDAAVTTWLHRIVVNACLDLARRRNARPQQPLGDREPAAPTDFPTAVDARVTVLTALRQLPPDQVAALVLVDIEGFPVTEVAAILEVPEGTVKSRCARARARLADIIGGNDQGAVDVGTSGDGGGR